MAAAVFVHLIVTLAHGAAHAGAGVPMPPVASVFVLAVVLAIPLAGLALTRLAERPGAWIVGLALGGSLVFGVVNHFVLDSADHVARVATGWRPLFATTAVLLSITEAAGALLAIGVIVGGRRTS
ncbi:MAG: hypothetical protein R2752_03845 [Vicinamibacterales bacterium]